MSVTESGSHSISRPIRTAPFLREASDWSASADLAARERAHTIQLATVTRPAIFLLKRWKSSLNFLLLFQSKLWLKQVGKNGD